MRRLRKKKKVGDSCMYKEDDFEEMKDWIIKTEDKQYYGLMGLTKSDLALLLSGTHNMFIEVVTLYEGEKIIIPINRIIQIRENINKKIKEEKE